MLTITLTALLITTAIAAVPHQETAGDAEEQKLQILYVSNEHLEANFFTETGGIHIVSEVRSNGDVARVSITSISGGTLFAVDYPIDRSQGILTLNDNEFYVVNETSSDGDAKMTAYFIPETYSHQVKTDMKLHLLSKSLLGQLDRENVNATARTAVESLMLHTDVQLIATAAGALGNTGIYGRDNPSAMAFYATALRFATVLSQDTTDNTIPPPTEAGKSNRERRWWPFATYCSNSDSYCYSSCPSGDSCLGLCGPGCNCWWFVCFDCCWNVGCYVHDVHFCSEGTDTWSCWLSAPVGLVCS